MDIFCAKIGFDYYIRYLLSNEEKRGNTSLNKVKTLDENISTYVAVPSLVCEQPSILPAARPLDFECKIQSNIRFLPIRIQYQLFSLL